jgi:hypothetical protein
LPRDAPAGRRETRQARRRSSPHSARRHPRILASRSQRTSTDRSGDERTSGMDCRKKCRAQLNRPSNSAQPCGWRGMRSRLPKPLGRAKAESLTPRTLARKGNEEPDEEGWVVARVVEVPGAVSQGRDREETRENVIDALRLMLSPITMMPASRLVEANSSTSSCPGEAARPRAAPDRSWRARSLKAPSTRNGEALTEAAQQPFLATPKSGRVSSARSADNSRSPRLTSRDLSRAHQSATLRRLRNPRRAPTSRTAWFGL